MDVSSRIVPHRNNACHWPEVVINLTVHTAEREPRSIDMKSYVFRHSQQDAYLVALSVLHPIALLLAPSIALIAAGVWWNSNTISHHFLHLPFFRSNAMNRLFSLYLTLLLGIPQSLWRDRHLSHHRGVNPATWFTSAIVFETILVATLWGLLIVVTPQFFLAVYLPGYAIGLLLCHVHGHFEHAGGTTSTYGAIYNLLFFNDGYHVEHHGSPSRHWTRVRESRLEDSKTSRWPAILRWLDVFNLEALERMVLRQRFLQWFLLRTHAKAIHRLIPYFPAIQSALIIGGGMYPRTAILLKSFLPNTKVRILDSKSEHLAMARPFLDDDAGMEQAHYGPNFPVETDLLVVPLSFNGSRQEIYRNPPAPAVLVHDWIWRKRGRSAIVSLLLLKRMNLILR